MSKLRRRSARTVATTLLTVAGLVVAGLPATGAPPTGATAPPADRPSAADQPPPTADQSATDPSTTGPAGQPAVPVTLVTGDTISYSGTPAGGFDLDLSDAENSLTTLSDATGVYAIPDQAAPLIAAGVLDPYLFNVSYLVENGYADQDTDQLPLIVTYPRPAGRASSAAAAGDGLSERAERLPATAAAVAMPSIHGAGVAVDKQNAGQFWRHIQAATDPAAAAPAAEQPAAAGRAAPSAGIANLWLDRTMRVSLTGSVPQIGAPSAWDAGYDGSGVRVAVLDTGYDPDHPDLAGRVLAADVFRDGDTVLDGHGHGTHVASTIAGSGAASGGDYTGVAPGADLLIGKVCSDSGGCLTSDVIAGMEWAIAEGASVVNMSLGGLPSDGSDPFSQAVDNLTATSGTLFVISAGNLGPEPGTVAQPAAAGSALAVAAIDGQDQLAEFSSRGPLPGSAALKPDLAAPGVRITAARSGHGTDMRGNAVPVGEDYLLASGTSMAAPHVAGSAAILAQRHPDWTAEQLKAALMSSAQPIGQSPYEVGAGRVDPVQAVTETVFATVGSVDFGLRPWPHQSDVDTRTVTYRNLDDQDVTLDLALSATDAAGVAAPPGLLTLESETLTVPAGGTASVVVTLTEAASTSTGVFGGALVASAGGDRRAHTPVGVVLDAPRYSVTFELILPEQAKTGPDHQPCAGHHMAVSELNNIRFRNLFFSDVDCTATATLYERPHMVHSWVSWPGPDGGRVEAGGFLPEFTPTENMTVPIDMRQARPLVVQTPQPTEVARRWVTFTRDTDAQSVSVSGGRALAHPRSEVRVLPAEPVRQGRFDVLDQLTMVHPFVELSVTTPEPIQLTAHYLDGDVVWPKLSGAGRLELVDAGSGTEAEFAGLDATGKLVLIGGDGYDPVAMRQASARATAAGAAAILLFADAPWGILSDAGRPATTQDAPAIAIPPSQGRQLRELAAAGAVRLNYSGTPESPYVYYSRVMHRDGIGSGTGPVVRALTDEEFTEVQASYHAEAPTVVRRDAVAHPKYISVVVYDHLPFRAPTVRTEFYGPRDDDLIWTDRYEQANRFATWLDDQPSWLNQRAIAFGLPGALPRPLSEPLTTPTAPQLSFWSRKQNICHVCREPAGLSVQLPYANGDGMWSMFSFLQGALGDGTPLAPNQQLTLTVDGQSQPPPQRISGPAYDPALQFVAYLFPLPSGTHELELSQRLTDFAPLPYGRSAETSWRFTAGSPGEPAENYRCVRGSSCTAQQLIFLDYDLSGLGLDNTAPAGRRFEFGVTPRFAHGIDAPIVDFTASVSYDGGETWQAADSRPVEPAGYRVTVDHPGAEPGAKVSVRIAATDTNGNQVVQTQPDLYGLDPDSCPDGHDDPTIRFGDQDSGVPNQSLADGCGFLDQVWAHAPYRNHGEFVRTVKALADEWQRAGRFTHREATAITVAAARSDIGKPGGRSVPA